MFQSDHQNDDRLAERVQEQRRRVAEFYATLDLLTPRVVATPLIIAACVLVFLLMVIYEPRTIVIASADTLMFWGANHGPQTVGGQWWRLFTCMFVHVHLLHLGLNMWVLWDIGRFMERVVGNLGFVVMYVVSGLCGSLASTYWNPSLVSAGASGAVFGLFGGLLGFLVLGRGSMPAEMVSRFRGSVVAFVGYNLVFGLVQRQVDNAAHLGGFFGGCLCGLLLGQPITKETGHYRWQRNLLALVLGGAGVVGGASLLPKTADVEAALRDFEETKAQSISTYNAGVQKVQSEELTPEDLAGIIERDVLPPWKAMRERLERLEHIPRQFAPLLEACVKFARLREEAWELQVSANRKPDEETIRKFESKLAAAQSASDELQRIGEELRQRR